MATKPLLVLGAGASNPYGFPTSGQLRSIILGNSDGDKALRDLGVSAAKLHEFFENRLSTREFSMDIKASVRHSGWVELPKDLCLCQGFLDVLFAESNFVSKFVSSFRDEFFKSKRVSIDAFISRWPEFKLAAQIAIAGVLLLCEEKRRLDGNWYVVLSEAILRRVDQFKKVGLRVINFNYDRSFQCFFDDAFSSYERRDNKDRLMNYIEESHIYGSLGPVISYQGTACAEYGDLTAMNVAPDTLDLARVSQQSPENENTFDEAEHVAFLGFGFWPENLDILRINPKAKVFASAMGLPNTIRAELEAHFPNLNLGTNSQTVLDYVLHTNSFGF